MNVTELARRLRVHPKELLRILPEYGFDIGGKAIKVDNKIAQKIMRSWPKIKLDQERKRQKEIEDKKKKEKELRKESGESVTLPKIITVREFADLLELPVTQIITELMKSGVLANQNQNIDYDTAAILAEDLGFSVNKQEEGEVNIEEEVQKSSALEEALKKGAKTESRPPVVVVMGHVDHGKTKLLDTIREANIIDTESGGITQHIGAYQTIWKDPKNSQERAITFIDTPGHEAFTVMRSRGAKVADIAILVVAADDGVKPQTKEVIQIMKAAKLPIVVAINKIDKPTADVQRTMGDLANNGLNPEAWGGDVPVVEISAKEKINIDKLLDMLLLVADMQEEEIQADPNIPAVGTIIESNVDKHMGPVATVLIQAGTLRKGEPLIIENEIFGKARALRDYHGVEMEEAGPSVPAQIIGFKVAPGVGEILNQADKKTAKKIDVKQKMSEQTGAETHKVLDYTGDEEEDKKKKLLNVIIRADVLGSLEAIISSLSQIKNEYVGVKIIGKGLGNITEQDVSRAEVANAKIIGFNVKPSFSAEEIMREKNIEYSKFEVIYHLIDWIKEELEKILEYEIVITEMGQMEIKAIFRTEKRTMIVGGVVKEGKAVVGKARIKRDGEDVGVVDVVSCQSGPSVVKSIPAGTEGGVKVEGKERIEVGDILEIYTEEKKIIKLDLDK